MPHFYFDVRDGEHSVSDPTGQRLDSRAQARDVAIGMLPELVAGSPMSGDRDIAVDVRDEQGSVILTARLTMTATWSETTRGRLHDGKGSALYIGTS